ncbi:transposase domain-containing protein [uncultured Amphritea sp.]|uniref:transposase domain-containing protein n=1 Tax=uncultured Amphritea sp. TaxID=981605 RepID=UPI0025F935E6|nr:transposase domain-containing protein [uncultured Amphritea sp.]
MAVQQQPLQRQPYSLIETAKGNGVEPRVLTELLAAESLNAIESHLPWNKQLN